MVDWKIRLICFLQVKVTGSVQNKGWVLEHIDYKDTSIPEKTRIRGFRIQKIEQLELNYTEPGNFCFKSWTRFWLCQAWPNIYVTNIYSFVSWNNRHILCRLFHFLFLKNKYKRWTFHYRKSNTVTHWPVTIMFDFVVLHI